MKFTTVQIRPVQLTGIQTLVFQTSWSVTQLVHGEYLVVDDQTRPTWVMSHCVVVGLQDPCIPTKKKNEILQMSYNVLYITVDKKELRSKR